MADGHAVREYKPRKLDVKPKSTFYIGIEGIKHCLFLTLRTADISDAVPFQEIT
jgi:hypothetical protein